MLRTRIDLSRSVVKWVSQVTASVGATLAATMIYAALPGAVLPQAPAPELTSGGKFAARAVVPTAYDGLDRMPLPQVLPAAVPVAAEAPGPGAPIHRATWEGPAPLAATPLVLAPERPARPTRSARSPVRTEGRHVAAPSEPAPRAAAIPAGAETVAASRAEDAPGDEGLMPRILSGARAAWSVTASTGGSLVARVVPQIP